MTMKKFFACNSYSKCSKTSIRKSSAILSRRLKTVTISYTKLIHFDKYQLCMYVVTIVSQIMLFISMITRF
jgi:hypothetical protein